MKEQVKIRSIKNATHDVLQITTDKPSNLNFVPGQATEVFIDKPEWKEKGRPFTFTSLPNDDHLEFIIKTYSDHNGVTNELNMLKTGDYLLLNDIFGAINYKGKGVFIAGGAGVTPFISILRNLQTKNEIAGNKLIFANNTANDIINKSEFENLLGTDFINILAKEKNKRYAHGYISEEFLENNISNKNVYFYLCGPPPMMDAVENSLKAIGISEELMVTEKF